MPHASNGSTRSSSGRARKSSTKIAPEPDEPSTSSMKELNEKAQFDADLKAALVGRLLKKIRDKRDSRDRDVTTTTTKIVEAAEENDKDLKTNKITALNEHIFQLEIRTSGQLLEESLKSSDYATILLPLPQKPEVPVSQNNKKALEPIEVKIDEVESTSASALSTAPHSLVSGTRDSNVEIAAKKEAEVVARVASLRRSGLWSGSRLPKCVEPARNKTHWDYLLEEMKWMAHDFRAERNAHANVAKKLASQISKLHRDRELEIEKAEQRELREGKKICAAIAKMVRDFWQNVDKVVDHRAQNILDSKKRKAMDQHLSVMVGEMDEISKIVQEGLNEAKNSKTPSIASDRDGEFSGGESDSDDETTIANAEKNLEGEEVKNEVAALENEANQDMDDFLASLPPEYLAMMAEKYGCSVEELQRPSTSKAIEKPAKVVEIKDDEKDQESTSNKSDDKESSSKDEETENDADEQNQDEKAEDGNGDGRGVLEHVNYAKLNSANSDERQNELANIAEEALKFQPKGYTLETTQVKTQVPFLVRGTLREYQMVGLDWLVTLYEKNLNGILADEMGLGKTIQTISLLAHLACSESIWGPHLIVVPTSVILNWEMEFKKWCPALKILTYFGSLKDRQEKRRGWSKPNSFHVCITSYKTITTDIRAFKMKAWQYLILDEAQNIKNWKSQRWQALLNVRARRRLLLTGTPLQNSLMELWSLMHFLMPAVFASHDDFKDWFSNPLTGMMEGSVEFNSSLVQRLHKVLRPFILRRLKKEVEKQMPSKTEHVVKCALSKRQRYLYDDFMSRKETRENLKTGNMMSVLNIVMQLRKCCNHPNLFEPRPVVTPFIIHKRRVRLPAALFHMIDNEDVGDKPIPEIFDLRSRIGSWQTQVRSRKPLVQELEQAEENDVRPPVVPGFRFQRVIFDNNMAAANGNGEPMETEDSQEDGHENALTNGAIDGGVTNGVVTENGTSKVNGTVAPKGFPYRSVAASIRSKTVLNTAPLSIATDTSGFHYAMANGGSRSTPVPSEQYSPPLKRVKMTGVGLNDFVDYVPHDVEERLMLSRQNQVDITLRRFGAIRKPIVANELVFVLRSQIFKSNNEKDKYDKKVAEMMVNYTDSLAKRFCMYVEPVVCDAFDCAPSSSGLPAYVRAATHEIEHSSRQLITELPERDDEIALARTVQFPELRLIEYDCGKLQILANLLRQLYLYKHRCLIFTQMSRMLDVLQAFLSHHGYQYFRLDGTTGIEQRQAMMERFNADSKIFCFILSTRSGGVGVNLTGADTVIFYDSDWNPTMDAQAQDRCHRIGQTRNVTIYRLISERTIEENILKKATQKRRLGEMAIDEAGFTPDFFKQTDNIRDLFDGESIDIGAPSDAPQDQNELEKAMSKLEDDVDVAAAKLATAEAKVDKAEFDDSSKQHVSRLGAEEPMDEQYLELINQFKPIERYAIAFLEEEYKPEFEEELKEADALIEQQKEDWSRSKERAIDGEEDNDDFYLGGNLLDELLAQGPEWNNELMPSWLPLSPPDSPNEFDNYFDDTFDLIYELDPMNEARLPSTIHELHRPFIKKQPPPKVKEHEAMFDVVSKSLQLGKMPTAMSPAYTDCSLSVTDESNDMKPDLATAEMQRIKRDKKYREPKSDAKSVREGVRRATTPPPPIREANDYDGAEWNIIEDYALLQAVENEERLGHVMSIRDAGGLQFNWEIIAQAVNRVSQFYRSGRQCSLRYQMTVYPRQLGQLLASDPITKKHVKVQLTPAEVVHMRKGRVSTQMQYAHDCGQIMDRRVFSRSKLVKELTAKKLRPFWMDNVDKCRVEPSTSVLGPNYDARVRELDISQAFDAEVVVLAQDDRIIAQMEARKRNTDRLEDKPPASPPPRQITVIRRPNVVSVNHTEGLLPLRPAMYIDVPPLMPATLPGRMPPQNVQSAQVGQQVLPIGQQGLQQTMQRRPTNTLTSSVSTSSLQQQQYIQQPATSHNFVVVSTAQSQSQDSNAPASMQRVAPSMPYMQGGIQQQPTPMYSTTTQLVVQAPRGPAPPQQRVVNRGPVGIPNRMIIPQGASRDTYLMQQPQQLRVVPGTGQRLQQVQKRVIPTQVPPGTVPTMVMQNRPGTVSQLRTINYPGQPGRRNVIVQSRPPGPSVTSAVGPGGSTVARQMLTPRMAVSRGGSPQSVAQVVLAPPAPTSSANLTAPPIASPLVTSQVPPTSQAPPVLQAQQPPSSMAPTNNQ